MTKGELLNAIADLPVDAEVVIYVREWGNGMNGQYHFIGKYIDLFDVEHEEEEGDVTIFLIGDDD